jgi:hypothetical protein
MNSGTDAILAGLAKAEDGVYVASSGEEWRPIVFPFYRQSDSPYASRWVSSWGRLLSQNGLVVDRRTGGSYQYTTITTRERAGTRGGKRGVGVNRLVAFTFLAKEYLKVDQDVSEESLGQMDRELEVDHIDRQPWNNWVGNLRFVTRQDNMNNRERLHFTAMVKTEDGAIDYTCFRDMATMLGSMVPAVRAAVDQADVGVPFDVNGIQVVVRWKVKKEIRPVLKAVEMNRAYKKYKVYDRAMDMFLEGLSITDIQGSWPTAIKARTLHSYMWEAANTKTRDELVPLATRLGWSGTHEMLIMTLESFRRDVAGIKQDGREVNQDEYDQAYRSIVEHYFPTMGEDWRVVQAVWKALLLT